MTLRPLTDQKSGVDKKNGGEAMVDNALGREGVGVDVVRAEKEGVEYR